MYYFTADEHYFHKNIIKFVNRPFNNIEEMNAFMINNHNRIVTDSDTTIHAGDFSFGNDGKTREIIKQLNGKHIFLQGSHDRWGHSDSRHFIWQGNINKQKLTVCHYAMKMWHCSHWNSWHLFGHSHGTFGHEGKTMDIGVDTNNFKPYSFTDIFNIMKTKPNNFNLIKKHEKN